MSLPRPPIGVYLPPELIFHPGLTAAALLTWVRLRSLSPDGWETPPLTLPVLAARLGVHPTRLTRHLAQLQEIGALDLRQAGEGKVTLSFPEEPILLPIPYHAIESYNNVSPASRSYGEDFELARSFPSRIMGYISYDDDHDPLYIEPERAELVTEKPEPANELSELAGCIPSGHTFAGK